MLGTAKAASAPDGSKSELAALPDPRGVPTLNSVRATPPAQLGSPGIDGWGPLTSLDSSRADRAETGRFPQ